MAFESMNNVKNMGFHRPFIRCTDNRAGGSTIYVSARTELRGKRVLIEIDREENMVRLRAATGSERGAQCIKQGVMSASKALVLACGTFRVYVEKREDGWWYGRLPEDMAFSKK
ncbi:hypothetical protein [Trabulsiella odontotermitis]|uniref:hypothetical protein n=1 Tax=Trabulsiella odontotermitis TaxID=379893 RepID=UPI0006769E35|nr:hypothetical protein [Trabulsiella odontotermitis]KNC91267.1 hypothetical protein GM30_23355 [Trabulsiella odontotermitis]